MTPSQLPDFVSFLLGLLATWLTVNIKNQKVQSLVNIAVACLIGALTTVVIDATVTWSTFNFGTYLEAIAVAWLATMRMHYTEFPQILFGRHEDLSNTKRTTDVTQFGAGENRV